MEEGPPKAASSGRWRAAAAAVRADMEEPAPVPSKGPGTSPQVGWAPLRGRRKPGQLAAAARRVAKVAPAAPAPPSGEDRAETYEEAFEEALSLAKGQIVQQRDSDADRSAFDRVAYRVENVLAMHAMAPFTFLAGIFAALVVAFGVAWYACLRYEHYTSLASFDSGRRLGEAPPDDEEAAVTCLPTAVLEGLVGGRQLLSTRLEEEVKSTVGYGSITESIWLSLQLLSAAGFDDTVPDLTTLRCVHFLAVVAGLVVFATLVGFITDAVATFMTSLSEGRTKVVEAGHTLILGTNEATPRLVTQIALTRRQYIIANEGWLRTLCPWLRVAPSTPVAASKVVVLTSSTSKKELDERLRSALAAKGISSRRTAIGSDVICRVGDATNIADLVRVGADTASSIVVMMTERDDEERDASNGKIENGATLRTLLALRHVIFTSANDAPSLNIVVQLARPSQHIAAACFKSVAGEAVVRPIDLSLFMNSLMFACAAQPGLSDVLMHLLDCDGDAFRRRRAPLFCGGVVGLTLRDAAGRLGSGTVVGLVSEAMADGGVQDGFGLCPDWNHVIEKTDLIIFIAVTASPIQSKRADLGAPADRARARDLRRRLRLDETATADALSPRSKKQKKKTRKQLPRRNFIVCGWRPVWTEETARLKQRIAQICLGVAAGSKIVFVNGVPPATFAEMMTDACAFEPKAEAESSSSSSSEDSRPRWVTPTGVIVEHCSGDAADINCLGPLMTTPRFAFDTAIVLGSQSRAIVAKAHSLQSQDTRVLDLMLLLRYLHDHSPWRDRRLRIVGENNLDDTSMLALGPRSARPANEVPASPSGNNNNGSGGDGPSSAALPDFVNTQAIYARALVLCLSYPKIFTSVAELFSDDGGAEVKIVPAASFVPVDGEATTWRVAQEAVALGDDDALDPRSRILIAFIDADATFRIGLAFDHPVTFTRHQRFVLITRAKVAPPSVNDRPSWLHPDNCSLRFAHSVTPGLALEQPLVKANAASGRLANCDDAGPLLDSTRSTKTDLVLENVT